MKYFPRKPSADKLESPELKRALAAKSLAVEEIDKTNNKDDPLSTFSFAVKSMQKKSKTNL